MTDKTEKWSRERYLAYAKTGTDPGEQTPERVEAIRVKRDRNVARLEKNLQSTCESWLTQRGYARLTAANADYSTDVKGWYGHLADTRASLKRNPLMPDLFMFDRTGRCLLVEFKVRDEYQPGQLAMIESGMWTECRTFEDFEMVVAGWENVKHEDLA